MLPEQSDSSGPTSVGRYLARQRKLRGISLEELAGLTRIPIRSLERLESGAFDRQPDGFARGFVRTVAKAIGLDPDETVARMLDEPVSESRVSVKALVRGVVVFVAVGVALVAAILAIETWRMKAAARAGAAVAEAAPALPVRRDAVRALALEVGLLEPEPTDSAEAATPPAALPAEPAVPLTLAEPEAPVTSVPTGEPATP